MPLGYNFSNVNNNTAIGSGTIAEPAFLEKSIVQPQVLPIEANPFGSPAPSPTPQPQATNTATKGMDWKAIWDQYQMPILIILAIILLGFVYWKWFR